MIKAAQIRIEFNEPIADVLKGFAEMGYSKTYTASHLGITRQTLSRYVHRFCKSDPFVLPQGEMRPESRPGGKGWKKGKKRNRPPKYTLDMILSEVQKYPNSTLFKTMGDIDYTTVVRRFGSFTNARKIANGKEILQRP